MMQKNTNSVNLGNDIAVRHEEYMRSVLKKLMTNEEIRASHVEFNYRSGINPIIIDFFCEKGISKLGLNGPVYVEFKTRLLVSSYQYIQKKAEDILRSHSKGFLLVVYQTSNVILPSDSNSHIQYYSIKSLKEKGDYREEGLKESDNEVSLEERNKRNIEEAIKALKNTPCTFFMGSGISVDAGAPIWNELLRLILVRNKNLDPLGSGDEDYNIIHKSLGYSPLITASYVLNINKDSKDELPALLHPLIYTRNEFNYIPIIPVLPKIAELIRDCDNIESVITFNYDNFLELELEKIGVAFTSVHEKGALKGKDLPIYHVHGYIPRSRKGGSREITLLEEDYHNKYSNDNHWSNIEIQHALIRNSCFFFGLSMTDPNLRRLLDYAKQEDEGKPRHYVFLIRDPLGLSPPDSKADEKHWERQEQIFEKMGVNIIWYNPINIEHNKHRKLSELLEIINKTIKNQNEI